MIYNCLCFKLFGRTLNIFEIESSTCSNKRRNTSPQALKIVPTIILYLEKDVKSIFCFPEVSFQISKQKTRKTVLKKLIAISKNHYSKNTLYVKKMCQALSIHRGGLAGYVPRLSRSKRRESRY